MKRYFSTAPLFAFFLAITVFSPPYMTGQTAGTALSFKQLRSGVNVTRDHRSIPYIDAENDNDLYFVQGYVTASDRLWQMDLLRRRASGETAEIFGNAALADDKVWRRYGFAKIAAENLQYVAPELRTALDSYAAGVNAYIASLTPETMPVEFTILKYSPKPWRAEDSVLIGKILAEALSSTWFQDLQRATNAAALSPEKFGDITNLVTPYDVILFGKDRPMAKGAARVTALPVDDGVMAKAREAWAIRERSLTDVGLFAEDLAASNNWVISGERTSDGKPILANDPHLSSTAPGIWYVAHLSTPTMRVAGVTFPGVPGIILGHNEQIAWGATNVGPDVQDLYLETFNTNGQYKTPSGWKDVTVRKEEIKVRKNPLNPETETVVFEVTETRNGVINLEEGGKRYALKWTARDPKNSEFEAFFKLNRAANWYDFKAALSRYGGASQNFVYADTSGNIGWHIAGAIPIRRSGHGEVPYDGSTDEGDWTGTIPFAELPNLYNPSSGLIITANQRIAGTDYKYPQLIRDAAPPWRARRLFDLLSAKKKIGVEDVRGAQHDIYNIPLSMLAKELARSGALSAETTSLLNAWDGSMKAESKAAVITNEIRGCIASKMAEANKPAPAPAIRERVLFWAVAQRAPRWLPSGFASYNDLFKSCEETSRKALSEPRRLGPDESKWRWDSVFRSRFNHPLAAAPLIGGQFLVEPKGVDGSGQTPNVGPYVSMRQIATPGDWDSTQLVIPLGQSGNPRSPYFRDQFDTWNNGKPAIFPFTKAAVAAAAKSSQTFSPAK